jgi:hypothetical protein
MRVLKTVWKFEEEHKVVGWVWHSDIITVEKIWFIQRVRMALLLSTIVTVQYAWKDRQIRVAGNSKSGKHTIDADAPPPLGCIFPRFSSIS